MNASGLTKPLAFFVCVVLATCTAVFVLRWTETRQIKSVGTEAEGQPADGSVADRTVGTNGAQATAHAGRGGTHAAEAPRGHGQAAGLAERSGDRPARVRPVQYLDQEGLPGGERESPVRPTQVSDTADDVSRTRESDANSPPLRFARRSQVQPQGPPVPAGTAPPGFNTNDLFRVLRQPFQPRDPALPQYRIPFSSELPPDAVQTDRDSGMVTIIVRDAPLGDILNVLAQQHGLDLITAEDISARLNLTLEKVPLETALTHMLSVTGYTWVRQGDVLIVTSMANGRALAPRAQGRALRVFGLDYAAAIDLDTVVKGLLSPAGQSFVMQTSDVDQRRTQEMLVVEDLPEYLDRITDYVRAVDVPPRQVLIEAHVLAVELTDEVDFGVNLQYLDQAGQSITVRTQGFADAAAFATGTAPAFFANIEAGDLTALIEALEETKDARTLARPKVLTLNGQRARIQVGQQLGFRVTTTTQTSTLESVEFLDTGVVLEVTPVITRDGNIVMNVKPEISTGEINPATELPEEDTTEVQTSLMLPSGHGMVIGGLIQEEDIENQMKIPILGDLWLVGRLFQRRETRRRRDEIIIALIPHIMPYGPQKHQEECHDFQRSATPLVYGPLNQNPRPFEPRFPDAAQFGTLPENIHRLHPPADPGGWMPECSEEQCLPEGLQYPPPAHGLPEPPQPVPPRPTGGPLLQPPVPDLLPPEEVPLPRGPVPDNRQPLMPPLPGGTGSQTPQADGSRRSSPWRPAERDSMAVEGAHRAPPRHAEAAVSLASGVQPMARSTGTSQAAGTGERDIPAGADEGECRRLPYCREYPR